MRRDEIIGQGRYVYQNTQLATGMSVIHKLVQKYETLPVLPKKLTETQEKSALFLRRGILDNTGDQSDVMSPLIELGSLPLLANMPLDPIYVLI